LRNVGRQQSVRGRRFRQRRGSGIDDLRGGVFHNDLLGNDPFRTHCRADKRLKQPKKD
jgi:hypothetical protein